MKRLLAATVFAFFAFGGISASYACDCNKDKKDCKECEHHKECKSGTCKHDHGDKAKPGDKPAASPAPAAPSAPATPK